MLLIFLVFVDSSYGLFPPINFSPMPSRGPEGQVRYRATVSPTLSFPPTINICTVTLEGVGSVR